MYHSSSNYNASRLAAAIFIKISLGITHNRVIKTITFYTEGGDTHPATIAILPQKMLQLNMTITF